MTVETELAAPALLIAMPQLGDPSFARGVVLMLDHGEHGSMGLLLNRPTDLDINSFCASQSLKWGAGKSSLVFQGGPVQPERAFILHASEHQGPETEPVIEGIRLSYSLESLQLLADAPPERCRVFLGYAGWGPNQLAEELTAGAWLLGQPSSRVVFDVGAEDLWETALGDMGIDPMQLMHSSAVH